MTLVVYGVSVLVQLLVGALLYTPPATAQHRTRAARLILTCPLAPVVLSWWVVRCTWRGARALVRDADIRLPTRVIEHGRGQLSHNPESDEV